MVVGEEIAGSTWIGLDNLRDDADTAVLLASFNRPVMVVNAIDSVLQQTYKHWNLYILDNNSVAHVKSILLQYRQHPGVAIFVSNTQAHQRLDKYWLGAMINIGMKKGCEPYLQPLTDDCYMLPHSLATKTFYMKQHPQVRVCFGGQYIIQRDGTLLRIRNALPRDYEIGHGSCLVDLCQTLFHRQLVEHAGYFNEDINKRPYPWIDALMFDEAEQRGYPLCSVGSKTDVFIEHGKSQMQYLRDGRLSELLTDDIWE